MAGSNWTLKSTGALTCTGTLTLSLLDVFSKSAIFVSVFTWFHSLTDICWAMHGSNTRFFTPHVKGLRLQYGTKETGLRRWTRAQLNFELSTRCLQGGHSHRNSLVKKWLVKSADVLWMIYGSGLVVKSESFQTTLVLLKQLLRWPDGRDLNQKVAREKLYRGGEA